MISKLKSDLCPEARDLQELGNELIARADYNETVLGRWAQGPMDGFSNDAERPTTVLTTPYPWLPEGDAERLVEATGLEYPIFSVGSAALFITQNLTVVRVALGGTMGRSLFEDQGRCTVDVSRQREGGRWGTSSFRQDGMNADAGIGYDPVDVLGLLDRIRQAA